MKTKGFIILFLSALLLVACKDEPKNRNLTIPENPRTDFGMQRSHEDTIAVMEMATQFLETLKQKDVEGALDQLYDVEHQEVKPLTASQRNDLRSTLKAFPVESYTLDAIILYSDSDSEVRYTTRMFPDSVESKIPGTVKGSLHPFRIDGKWYLTIQPKKFEQ
ncbi:MAG: hypothetical protein IKH88_03255 [Prevotella sp.]|nr:hypothetical protein [Prevotella sp.]